LLLCGSVIVIDVKK